MIVCDINKGGEVMYELTEEQIKQILDDYEASLKTVKEVALKLNEIGIVKTDDDFYTLICEITPERENDLAEKNGRTLDELVEFYLRDMYNDYENLIVSDSSNTDDDDYGYSDSQDFDYKGPHKL